MIKLSKSFFFNPPIVAFDVDDTLINSDFPEIISLKPYCLEMLNEVQDAGWRTILWTCREDRYLQQVKNYFEIYGIKFDAYNDNSAIRDEEWKGLPIKDTRKIGCDILVDDRSIFYVDDLRMVKEKLLELYDERGK
ncbi:MAG: NIF family HAD-type phosphatase [Bacteroidales bacterium]